jgi:hypothetical protein
VRSNHPADAGTISAMSRTDIHIASPRISP